eukprot:1979427-Pyramimonas_sp.AAC.1
MARSGWRTGRGGGRRGCARGGGREGRRGGGGRGGRGGGQRAGEGGAGGPSPAARNKETVQRGLKRGSRGGLEGA